MTEKWFYCSCKCTIHESKIEKACGLKLKNGKIWNGKVCPVHELGIAQKRITLCSDCGKKLYSGILGGLPFRCPECSITHTKTKTRKRKKNGGLPDKPKIKYSGRGEYCLSKPGCEKYPDCDGCDDYVPIFRGVDPIVRGVWAI